MRSPRRTTACASVHQANRGYGGALKAGFAAAAG